MSYTSTTRVRGAGRRARPAAGEGAGSGRGRAGLGGHSGGAVMSSAAGGHRLPHSEGGEDRRLPSPGTARGGLG